MRLRSGQKDASADDENGSNEEAAVACFTSSARTQHVSNVKELLVKGVMHRDLRALLDTAETAASLPLNCSLDWRPFCFLSYAAEVPVNAAQCLRQTLPSTSPADRPSVFLELIFASLACQKECEIFNSLQIHLANPQYHKSSLVAGYAALVAFVLFERETQAASGASTHAAAEFKRFAQIHFERSNHCDDTFDAYYVSLLHKSGNEAKALEWLRASILVHPQSPPLLLLLWTLSDDAIERVQAATVLARVDPKFCRERQLYRSLASQDQMLFWLNQIDACFADEEAWTVFCSCIESSTVDDLKDFVENVISVDFLFLSWDANVIALVADSRIRAFVQEKVLFVKSKLEAAAVA